QVFDGAHLFAFDRADARRAGADRLAVEQDGAGAAAAFAAAVLTAGEVQIVAQDAQQAPVGVGFDGPFAAVDVQFLDGRHETPPPRKRGRCINVRATGTGSG